MSQNPYWQNLGVQDEISEETHEVGRVPDFGYIDILRSDEIGGLRKENHELKRKLKDLEERTGRKITIQFLESQKLALKKSVDVILVYSPESQLYIVENIELNIYGEGRDENEAINDFKATLEETYFSLKKDEDKLGPRLKQEWKFLDEFIQEK